MRVLACHNYYQLRGGEDVSFEQEADLLTQHGHEVHRFVLHNDQLNDLSPARAALATLWNRQSYRSMRQMIRSLRPEAVHCTNTFPLMSPSVIHAAHREGVPVVQALRNYRLMCAKAHFLRDSQPCELCLTGSAWNAVRYRCYRENRAATAVTVATQLFHRRLGTWRNKVDLFYTLTNFARGKFIEAGLPAERIVVKPNFAPRPQVTSTAMKSGAIFVGRLSAEKGIETLLNAWPKVAGDIRLTIVGDGPLAERVRASAAADPRIRWLGERPHEEVQSALAEAAMLVMPSINYETFGRAIVEAFSLATPVIASRLGAMADIVHDGVNGRHFTAGDPAALAQAMNEMFADETARAALGRGALAEYEANYTPERNCQLLLAVYEQAQALHAARAGQYVAAAPAQAELLAPVTNGKNCESTHLPSGEELETPPVIWPRKYELFGVQLSATDYQQATDCLIAAAKRRQSAIASFQAVHAVVTSSRDAKLRSMVNTFDLVGPDGQPVRWALNLMHRTGLRDRVYGPEMMLRLCRRAAVEGLPIFLYGGTPEVLAALQKNLVQLVPALVIVGSHAPPFRPLTAEEQAAVNESIRASGARIVFIGLGAPKQDIWAYQQRGELALVQVCVGAAFDFHAGVKRTAPRWMKNAGLEWLFRLGQEPRRLWKRYAVTNSLFIGKLVREWLLRGGNRRIARDTQTTPSNFV